MIEFNGKVYLSAYSVIQFRPLRLRIKARAEDMRSRTVFRYTFGGNGLLVSQEKTGETTACRK